MARIWFGLVIVVSTAIAYGDSPGKEFSDAMALVGTSQPWIRDVELSARGDRLAVSGQIGIDAAVQGYVQVYDLETGKLVGSLREGGQIDDLIFDGNVVRFFVTSGSGKHGEITHADILANVQTRREARRWVPETETASKQCVGCEPRFETAADRRIVRHERTGEPVFRCPTTAVAQAESVAACVTHGGELVLIDVATFTVRWTRHNDWSDQLTIDRTVRVVAATQAGGRGRPYVNLYRIDSGARVMTIRPADEVAEVVKIVAKAVPSSAPPAQPVVVTVVEEETESGGRGLRAAGVAVIGFAIVTVLLLIARRRRTAFTALALVCVAITTMTVGAVHWVAAPSAKVDGRTTEDIAGAPVGALELAGQHARSRELPNNFDECAAAGGQATGPKLDSIENIVRPPTCKLGYAESQHPALYAACTEAGGRRQQQRCELNFTGLMSERGELAFLVEQLANDRGHRRTATRWLARRRAAVAGNLEALLDAPSRDARLAASLLLAADSHPRGIAMWIALSGDRDPTFRQEVLWSLGDLDGELNERRYPRRARHGRTAVAWPASILDAVADRVSDGDVSVAGTARSLLVQLEPTTLKVSDECRDNPLAKGC